MDDGGPLAGIRAVENATGLAAAYAGFLLAGLGADVVKVEPTTPRATPGEHVVNRGKRSVIEVPTLAVADVVLTDDGTREPPPPDGVVRCRVSAWGGASDLPADEALLAAATGIQAMQWAWNRQPVWLVTPVITYMTGILAALGTTAALLARERGAPGQRVAVSGLQAALALNSGTYVTGRETRGSLSQFGDPRGQIATYALFQTADGWVFIGALTPAFVVKLMTVLDRVDLLAHPLLQGPPLGYGVPEIKALVRSELDPILATRTTAEWICVLREADIPCGAVRTREDAIADDDARRLGLVVPLADPVLGPTWQPGPPAGFSDTPAPPLRAASVPGNDPAPAAAPRRARRSSGPAPRTSLEGIRVLDLASFIAGPVCPMLLADLGADVVKIESADGDPFRMAIFAFVGWNRGKRSLVLDLKRPDGRDVFLDLARRADVVVDNFRGGVMERLGIGWETLHALNPRLVHTSITGYGQSGPLATLPGFDPIFQAQSGLMAAQGGADDPVFHMVAYNDYAAGALGALVTVAALFARERTGRGQRVDASLFRTSYVAQALDMIACAGRPPSPIGGRDYVGPSAARRIYPVADGFVCIAASTPAHAAALGRVAGTPVALTDPPDGIVATAVARAIAGSSRAEALDRLRAAGVPAAPCLGFQELFTDAVLRAGGCILEHEHPVLGPLLMPGAFIDLDATPVVVARSSPVLGADGAEVLAEMGYAPERIDALVAAGTVGRPA